jgi:hypothetical protein
VRDRFVSTAGSVCVPGVAADRRCVPGRMRLIDRDHMLVDVVPVRMVQVAVVQIVDVVLVLHGGVTATRSMLVRVGAFVDLVAHTRTLGPHGSASKQLLQTRPLAA